ncbi:MAG: 2Fe-2S iron-sulfur cluster binding domain-containing protein [Chromatiales bacterium]|nr:2Fe-2S iron-sulfur cluster binding domain-containing protein [Chromatiales bacterium]
MPRIHVTDRAGNRHELDVDSGLTLMEPLREIDNGIEALCGGMCSCATCHVFITPEWYAKLPDRHGDELELLESTECFRDGESRLACQVQVTDSIEGLELTVAPEE